MPVKFTFANRLMKSWLLIHQSHNLLDRCENAIFAKMGLTTRQHSVLLAIKNLPDPITVTDVARWLDRNPNGISMIIDRMEKDGLVRRLKNMADRRAVRLIMTRKGEEVYEEARVFTWQLFQDIFSEISEKDLFSLCGILEEVRLKVLDFLKIDISADKIQVLGERKKYVPGSDDDDNQPTVRFSGGK